MLVTRLRLLRLLAGNTGSDCATFDGRAIFDANAFATCRN